MRCPVCKTPHDRLATACDCGHVFTSAVPAPVRPPEPAPDRPPARSPERPRPRPTALERKVRAAAPVEHLIVFKGDGGALLGLHLINLFKTSLTFGVYHFWAKVAVRQYLYAQTEFHGDRFGYHGTGKELLVGWLKIAGIFLGIGALVLWLELGQKVAWAGLVGWALTLLVSLVLLPMAIVGSTRYRLSRTSWRGIRFSFRGSVRGFAPILVKGLLLSLVTFGLYTPFMQNHARRYLTEQTWFGSARFRYDGDAWPLFWPYVAQTLLWVPTFGLIWFWYRARRDRHFWSHTTFEGARFACSITGFGLWKLMAVNMGIMLLSFGLGKPWVEVRKLHFLCANLKLVGPLDVEGIHQQAQAASAAGEGLTDFMETGLLDVEVGL